jgi:hypothetical protein
MLAGMTTPIVIPITQETIDQAQQRSSSHCMIADALKLANPDLRFVSVDLQTIRFSTPKGKRYVYLTPPKAQRALINFDQGLPSEPMTITLHKPSQILKAHTKANAPKNADGTAKTYNRKGRNHSDPAKPSSKATVNSRGIKIGGNVPPNAVLSNNQGRVRSFGLSQLKD